MDSGGGASFHRLLLVRVAEVYEAHVRNAPDGALARQSVHLPLHRVLRRRAAVVVPRPPAHRRLRRPRHAGREAANGGAPRGLRSFVKDTELGSSLISVV
eukprot:gene17319-biopygen13664